MAFALVMVLVMVLVSSYNFKTTQATNHKAQHHRTMGAQKQKHNTTPPTD